MGGWGGGGWGVVGGSDKVGSENNKDRNIEHQARTALTTHPHPCHPHHPLGMTFINIRRIMGSRISVPINKTPL
jgi:hypothetical protein